MPLQIIQCEITAIELDAVVRFTDETLLSPGWEDPLARRAGPELQEACRALGG